MLFWDIIRGFFVKYIFGGTFDGEYYLTYLGDIQTIIDGSVDDIYLAPSTEVYVGIGGNGFSLDYAITFGDWLSTTATIITMVGICIGLFMLVRWFFKIGAGFIGLRG